MSIYKKLFEAKKEIGKISKDSTNPFYKSKYFDINTLLEHLEPILESHGLLLIQPIQDNKICTLILDKDNPEDCVRSEIVLAANVDPQKKGIEITYYRRYTLVSLLCLQSEDDDGNGLATPPVDDKKWLNENSTEWKGALSKKSSLETMMKYFKVSKENQAKYQLALKQ